MPMRCCDIELSPSRHICPVIFSYVSECWERTSWHVSITPPSHTCLTWGCCKCHDVMIDLSCHDVSINVSRYVTNSGNIVTLRWYPLCVVGACMITRSRACSQELLPASLNSPPCKYLPRIQALTWMWGILLSVFCSVDLAIGVVFKVLHCHF